MEIKKINSSHVLLNSTLDHQEVWAHQQCSEKGYDAPKFRVANFPRSWCLSKFSTDETKVELLMTITQNTMLVKTTPHISTNTSYHLSTTVVEGWWFELVLQPQDVDTLQSLNRPWILQHTKIFYFLNMRQFVKQIKLGFNQVLQQGDDPSHSSKSTTEWLKKTRIQVLQLSAQNPDLNLTETLWWGP